MKIFKNVLVVVGVLFVCRTSYAVVTIPLNNYSCETSLCIPKEPQAVGGPNSMDGMHVFSFANSNSNSLFFRVNLTNLGSQCFEANMKLSCDFSYAIYGPFQTQNDLTICAELNSFLLTPIRNGSVNGGVLFEPFLANDNSGIYLIHIVPNNCTSGSVYFGNWDFANCFKPCNAVDCADCLTSFQPSPGSYIVSAWVRESYIDAETVTFEHSKLFISFEGDPAEYSLFPSGQIIDGWQRIEGVIEVPDDATEIHIDFMALQASINCFFDDVRFFPFDGSMLSYVYDPYTLRLMAQLDDRNYATFYEYDEEGHLIRIKRETERGIMTIEENRTNIRRRILD